MRFEIKTGAELVDSELSKDRLRSWRAARLDVPGAAAAVADGFELGRRIFGELLR